MSQSQSRRHQIYLEAWAQSKSLCTRASGKPEQFVQPVWVEDLAIGIRDVNFPARSGQATCFCVSKGRARKQNARMLIAFCRVNNESWH
jgi:hypothetical protein